MSSSRLKNSLLFKTASIFLVFSFLMYNTAFSAVQGKLTAPEAADAKAILAVDDIGIAIDAGTVKSRYSGASGKVIVHIQDAHCNFEAQTNINKMLDQLSKECGINMISVEGAEGIVDTAWFKAFPDAEIRKEVATYFMKKGEITGAEFFSITSDYDGSIFGAETREYYVQNLRSFTEVYPHKETIEKYFTNLRMIANRLKAIVYPRELKALDSKIRAFDDKELELSDFAAYLNRSIKRNKIDIKKYPNFEKLTQTLEYEDKIDFDIVDAERSAYIDALSEKLTKEQMTELVAESIRFKKGHIKAVDFYTYLRDKAKEHDIAIVQEYTNLFYYYIYTKLYAGIDNEGLFKEIDRIERALKEKMFTDDTQRKLDKHSEMVDMYIDLANIELTNEDYDLFNQYKGEFSIQDTLDFIGTLSSRYNLNYSIDTLPSQIGTNMPKMIAFYEIAMKRDHALIDNTLKQMESEGKDRCVLIAGGFHTRGIKDLLEKKSISYIVVTPKITKDVETPYIKVLTNQRTSLEDIITESAAVPAAGITASREEIIRRKDDLVAAPNRVFWTINMLLKDRASLERLSREIGAVEVTEDGQVVRRTLLDATEETYKDIVSGVIAGWLLSIRDEEVDGEMIVSNDQWQEAVRNWRALLAGYHDKVAAGESDTELDVKIKQAIRDKFYEIFEGQRLIDHGIVNDYIIGNLPKGLYGETLKVRQDNLQRLFPDTQVSEEYKVSARVIPIEGLYEATGLKAQIGLGQAYGEPVIYVDSNFENDENVLNHELYEISKWAEKQRELQRELGITPDKMRGWITLPDNIDEARRLGNEWHRNNPHSVADHRPDSIMFVYSEVDDIILAANAQDRQEAQENRRANLSEIREIVADSKGTSEVLAVTNEGDSGIVEADLSQLRSKIFRRDGNVKIKAHEEVTRRGQFLGLLDAMNGFGDFDKDSVSLGIMMPGQGTRMSPATQGNYGIKPFIPMLIRTDKDSPWLSGATASLYTWGLVAYYLEQMGFRGIAWKWGDEPQVASNRLKALLDSGVDMSETDVIRFGSKILVTEDLARNKEWLSAEEDGTLIANVRRRERAALLDKLGIEDTPDAKAYVHIGSPAFSYIFYEEAREVFKDVPQGSW
ncbi:MAG: hypothetical protein HQ594_05155, partial [Candidatus Omnitrophica bacterium]|nr:hypothetical protein [Candidatus Omnitrophota bacterium]